MRAQELRVDVNDDRKVDEFNALFVNCCERLCVAMEPLPIEITIGQASTLLGVKRTVVSVYLSQGTLRREGRGVSFDSVVERMLLVRPKGQ